ncbi:MAG TPA: dethiobiotin synthase [Verrucomicrobiae bacterium]|nr:dethiobiotin synthase [Verrucomicrobiae bacterium]
MSRTILFITGTDTAVGKTVLTALLTRHLRRLGVAVAALKPVSSGKRDDARALHAALNGALTLDEINPWHFRVPLAPLLAARREGKKVRLAQVTRRIRAIQRRFDVVLVEGAGGLLSPIGEDFDSRDLIVALRARPIVLCPNRLGAVNQALLVMEALPESAARRTQLVLVDPPHRDLASETNLPLLAELVGRTRIHRLPWMRRWRTLKECSRRASVRRTCTGLTRSAIE